MKRETPYPQKRQPPKMMAVQEHKSLMHIKDIEIESLQNLLNDIQQRFNTYKNNHAIEKRQILEALGEL